MGERSDGSGECEKGEMLEEEKVTRKNYKKGGVENVSL